MRLTKNILDAQIYALKQHAHKEYGENVPYAVHLIYVVSVIQRHIGSLKKEDHEAVVIAGWLHDVCEDSGISYNEIKKLFGERVANIVGSVTNEWGASRNEKSSKTLPKTAQNRLGVYVKLADRIVNTSFSKMTGSSMYKKYCTEYEEFKKVLYASDEYESMWSELDELSLKVETPVIFPTYS